jgi:hypothetical protein
VKAAALNQEVETEAEAPGPSIDEIIAGNVSMPLIPVDGRMPRQYGEAVRAIAACTTLNESLHWSQRAEALSAWARMYGEDLVGAEARRLKLHAYRRMAQLAQQLTPNWKPRARGTVSPRTLLVNHGLTPGQANTIRGIGALPQKRFDAAIKAEKPPTPGTLVHIDCADSPAWARTKRAASVFRTVANHQNPRELATKIPEGQRMHAKVMAAELIGWLQRFERALL